MNRIEVASPETGSKLPAGQMFVKYFLPLLGMLLLWSFLRSPISAVNEPHYFCKAKHFWNPQWCANDFFLTSSNPHFVFYCCVGPLTEYFSLFTTTSIVRVIGLSLLAWGWLRMTAPLLRLPWQQCLAMSMLLLLQASVNFSGEWLVGGAESKVFAYGLGFWAIGTWQQKRSLTTAALLGLAVAFHSLVGCWLTTAVLMEYAWRIRREIIRSPTQIMRKTTASWREILAWVLCSLPGLLPALSLLFTPADAWTKFAGNYLQVYFRLKHHLDPMEFESWRYVSYGAMFIVAAICYFKLKKEAGKNTSQLRILFGLLIASLVIAASGVLIGLRWSEPGAMPGLNWRVGLLKFYPFRLFDLLMPVILAINFVLLVSRNRIFASRWQAHFLWIVVFGIAICIPFGDLNSSRMTKQRKQAWLETCTWAREETPEDAVFITPKSSWAFKWYAHRAEYVSRKDCPQDAAGIVEWNARLMQLKQWKRNCFKDLYYSQQETDRLAKQTAAQFLIANKETPFETKPVFENEYFRVYLLGVRR